MIIENLNIVQLIQFGSIIVLFNGLLLAEIVIASGIIMQQLSLLKQSKNPIETIRPKKVLSKQEKLLLNEKSIEAQLELG
jgi:hypothetical protein